MTQEPYRIPTWGITVKLSGIGDPFTTPDTDDTRREDEPGDWFVADFDGECSRCARPFGKNVTVRADGAGDFECRVCVSEDERLRADQDAYEAYLLFGQAFGEDWGKVS